MMRMRTKNDVLLHDFNVGGGGGGCEKEWELRPGGMLVQKRTDGGENRAPPPTIRVRVKYGSIYHEIRISSQSTFGELKKMLSGPTGLHHQDQKLLYKDKERDSNVYFDSVGVKDKSKLVLEEDCISKEKRFLEMKKTAKMEKATKNLSDIRLEVDKLAGQVSALETVISKGGKVVEMDVVKLIELFMNQLVKLDGIIADDDVKSQRKVQVTRVQKYVEKLDVIKLKNSNATGAQQARQSFGDSDSVKQQEQEQAVSVVITTQWETFDSITNPFLGGPSTSNMEKSTTQPGFTWDLL